MASVATNPDNEDFRSRYANETAGMPPALADIAARNLAANDASISNVNAVARLNPSQVVGSPYSTPQSDATNLSVADAMDRADAFDRGVSPTSVSTTTSPTLADAHADDIMARRSQIEGQKRQAMINLGMIPPDPGTAVVLPSTDKQGQLRRKELLQTLGALEDESNNLLREHQDLTVFNAKQAHENLVRQEHIQASSGIAKILNGITQIGSQYVKGTPEHDQAVLQLLGSDDPEIAAARGTDSFEKILRPYAENSDRAALTAQRIKDAISNFRSATGREPGSVEITAGGGLNLRSGSVQADTADKELYDAYGIRSANLQNPLEVAVVDKGDSTGKGDSAGNFVKVRTLPKGRPTTVYMPKTDYLKFGGKLSPSDAAAGLTTESTTAAPTAAAPSETTPPNITPEAHAALKPGDKFWWNGKQLTKK